MHVQQNINQKNATSSYTSEVKNETAGSSENC